MAEINSVEVDRDTTALVLVDLQTRIVALETAPYTGEQVLANGIRLAEAFRAAGLPVFLVRAHRPQPVQPPHSEIAPALGPRPGDVVITKGTWGAFHRTDLDSELSARGIRTIVLGGLVTNFGVESTARAADEHGYALVFAEDAMAGRDAEMHAFSVQRILSLLGPVVSTDQILTGLG
ncbi:MAG: isochorismatase family protein [Mycobacteriales bacterium]|jgi:nicotinamidase-related amidase